MIKQLILSITLLTFLVSGNIANAQEVKVSNNDSLISIVKKYYDLNVIVFQKDSKPSDIDEIFKLFTEDFTYVHPKYGGTYTRETLYKGYIRNQKKGMYDGTISAITILNSITGLNAVVVKRVYIEKNGNLKKEGDSRMTLFEFKEGKIQRIFEYW